MKKINYLLIASVAVMFFVAACGKDGATGPQGATGITGAQGTTGAIGPAGPAGTNGKDGSVIYKGTTIPATTLGVNGDFYLNTTTSLLYGPKTAAGWGIGFSLKGATGATGATGAAGSKTLSGTGVPSAALGNFGDYYLDKTSYLLYGPKTATGWGPAVSLQGPAGPAGPAGTANVQYSGWNYATNFRDTTADNSALKAGDLIASTLTQSMLDNGAYMIYFTFGGGVYALPYTSYAGGKQNTISFFPRLGHFIITRFTADNSNSVPLSTLLQYRYVIIPGGQNVGLNNHVNLSDYEAVRKFYRIPD